ncbi:MAG TPA: peroxiredoxin [Candidatus Limnocylindria bacterium]|nr:peroxiredoxin [Candidatus Limnocylindria bacterium]
MQNHSIRYVMAAIIGGFISSCGAKVKEAVHVGQQAPRFTMLDDTETSRSLEQMRGAKLVLYFYPKDNTPGCTKEACSLRDGYTQLQHAGITVWGVSYDSPAAHRKFKEKHNLPFTLLSDADKSVSKMYGVSGWFFPSRVTFLINEAGTIVAIMNDVDVSDHAQQILTTFAQRSPCA